MEHIKNIEKLFSKEFVENPLIESFEIGNINLPSGNLVALDPLTTSGMPSFQVKFPVGEFPVIIHKERDNNCVAYAEIVFSKQKPASWTMATLEGQRIEELGKGEIFGYPVQSGMGCFMDEKTQEELEKLEQVLIERQGDDYQGLYQAFFHEYFYEKDGAVHQWAILKPSEEFEGTIASFEAGLGEGFYASYIGFSSEGAPVKIVTEFIEVGS